jgi:nitroreductase / dihydropteridine reductase
MNILDSLKWRYAVKRMTGEKVAQEKVDIILEAARLAPSSSGIQPFVILQITDRQLLEKIRPIAFNQPQITEGSHLLVFAAWTDVTPGHVERVFRHIAAERNLPADANKDYMARVQGHFAAMTPEQRAQWAARQAYIALGIAIAAAAEERVDTTPMEGFNSTELDNLLGLPEKGLHSLSLLALGHRDPANDWLVNLKKVRRSKEEFVIEL